MRLLCDKQPTLNLTEADCIELELKLNVTSKSRPWAHIGQILYEYGTKKRGALNNILLEKEEYDFLKILYNKPTWTACKGL